MHRGGAEPRDATTPAPLHHRAKWRQESALLASTELPCPWSVLRQPTYLENFANDANAAQGTELRLLRPGVVSGLLDPEDELTVISVDDLGAMAVSMLRHGPEAYGGRVVPVGAERISGRSLAAAASRAHGRCAFEYRQVPWWVLEWLIPVDYPKQLKRWLTSGGNDEGARPDAHEAVFAESRRLHPDVTSVEEWLVSKGVRELPLPLWQRLVATSDDADRFGRRAVMGSALVAGLPALATATSLLPRALHPRVPPTAGATSLLADSSPADTPR